MLMASQIEEAIRRCFEYPDDEGVLTEFDRLFRPFVLLALSRIARHHASAIEDAYQTAFIKYIEIFREKRRPKRSYANYLLVVAKNALLDQLRSKERMAALEGLWDELFGGQTVRTSPLDRLLLLEAMMSVGVPCQFTLEKFYLAGATVEEIGRALDISPASVYVRLQRCREELRSFLIHTHGRGR